MKAASSSTLQHTGSWPRRIGILNDYVRIPYANGSSFASQRLYRDWSRQGREVTVIGPHDPRATQADLPLRNVQLPSLPLRNHPGVHLPLPSRRGLAAVRACRLDVALAQAGSELIGLGAWLRAVARVPFLAVNTIHLPSVYNVLLPDWLNDNRTVQRLFERRVIPALERHAASLYNRGDGLVVLSRGLERYWRRRGVTVPIHVIPRNVDPSVLDVDVSRARDPFDPRASRGGRLLVLCRHTREKGIERLLRSFATRIAPAHPNATLTLVGDGPDHDAFRTLARTLGVEARTFFPGEASVVDTPRWYRHADLFVYTSLSETYGQVVSEALWCGLPVVAFADDMGVSEQVDPKTDGFLFEPGPDADAADERFAAGVSELLSDEIRRRALGTAAARRARARCSPEAALARYDEAFAAAREHLLADTTRPPALPARLFPLLKWAAVHALAGAGGLLRRPAVLNRHNARHLTWDEAPAPRALPPAGAATVVPTLASLQPE